MLQINAVTPTPPSIIPHPHRLAAWREAREKLCADGQASTPVVIVEIIANNAQVAFSTILPISSVSLAVAKSKQPFKGHSVITGYSCIPMATPPCLEFINTFIRADTKNKLLLRMDMREEDREVIRAVGRGEDTAAVLILRKKMEREGIYILHQTA